MNNQALLMMIITEVIITAVTVTFFYRALTTPAKSEPDSYSDNDDTNLMTNN